MTEREEQKARELVKPLREEALMRIYLAKESRHANISEAPFEAARQETLARMDMLERGWAGALAACALETFDRAILIIQSTKLVGVGRTADEAQKFYIDELKSAALERAAGGK